MTVNLITSPGLEYGIDGWADHAVAFPGMTGLVWERQTGWAHSGIYSMRQTSVAANTLYTTNIYGVAGSYLAPLINVVPGDTFTLQAWVNNLIALANGSPGLWLEMFWFFFDGNPNNTALIHQDNGTSIYTNEARAIGVQELTMTRSCPEGATHLQVLCVGATNTPFATVDFYTDDVLLWKGDHVVSYFDGDTPNSDWVGIPGASTSVTPATYKLSPAMTMYTYGGTTNVNAMDLLLAR